MPEVPATPKTTTERMRSAWPDKLRPMKVNDTLYIKHTDLEPLRAQIMVRNFEQRTNRRLGGKVVLYNVLSDEKGTLITCIQRKRGIDITKRPSGSNQYSAQKKNMKAKADLAPIRAEATLRAAGESSEVQHLADGEEPCAILIALYPNGTSKLIFVKDAEQHGHLLNKIMKEGLAASVQTFAAGKIMKRKVSWEG